MLYRCDSCGKLLDARKDAIYGGYVRLINSSVEKSYGHLCDDCSEKLKEEFTRFKGKGEA